jgi:hypothetical protein
MVMRRSIAEDCKMARPIVKSWRPEDIALLLELAASGATLLRASAALGRPISSVRKKAHQLGTTFPGVRQVRAALRETGAIEPSRPR